MNPALMKLNESPHIDILFMKLTDTFQSCHFCSNTFTGFPLPISFMKPLPMYTLNLSDFSSSDRSCCMLLFFYFNIYPEAVIYSSPISLYLPSRFHCLWLSPWNACPSLSQSLSFSPRLSPSATFNAALFGCTRLSCGPLGP